MEVLSDLGEDEELNGDDHPQTLRFESIPTPLDDSDADRLSDRSAAMVAIGDDIYIIGGTVEHMKGQLNSDIFNRSLIHIFFAEKPLRLGL